MNSLLITAPILHGELETWRRCCAELLGPRRDDYHHAIREGGVLRLRVWHQRGPEGTDLAVVLYEGPAPERFLGRIATSDDAFCTWFRTQLKDVHGIDLTLPVPPPPELMIDENLPATTYSCSRVGVEDATRWRAVMDELRPLRVSLGQVSEEIFESATNAREITVLLGWRSEEAARKYYAHPELRAAVERAGGVQGRDMQFLVTRG